MTKNQALLEAPVADSAMSPAAPVREPAAGTVENPGISDVHYAERNMRAELAVLLKAIAECQSTEEAKELADICGEFGHTLLNFKDRAWMKHDRLNELKRWKRR